MKPGCVARRVLGTLLPLGLAGAAAATDLSIGVCTIPGAEAATCADYDWFDLTAARNSGATWVVDVSGDGTTLVGSENDRAYRWVDGQAVEVPVPAVFELAEASLVSHDGRAVAGSVVVVKPWLGPLYFFHWDEEIGFRILDLPPDRQHHLEDMSPNGEWVVGATDPLAPDFGRAFRWEYGTTRMLGGDGSWAYATNDETTVGNEGGMVRWAADGTSGWLANGVGGQPFGISADGSLVVGAGSDGIDDGAVLIENDVPTLLTVNVGLVRNAAEDLSNDGSLIVGVSDLEAVVWQAGVMRPLADVLSDDLGVSLGGHTLRTARAMSDDGRVLIGQARDASNRSGNFVAVLSPKVGLDVAPDDASNTIVLAQLSEIEAVVFGSDRTDIADLDAASLAFGPGAAPAASELATEDVNGDGHMDRRFAFSLAASSLEPGTSKACLHGRADGHPFRVCSAVTVMAPAVPALPAPALALLAALLLGSAALFRPRPRA